MRALVGLIALAAAPSIASAQPTAPAPARERAGLIFEGEAGLGTLGASNPDDEDLGAVAIAATGRFGGYLTPRTTLLLIAGAMGGELGDESGGPGSLSELFLGAAFRYWFSERWWLEASLATARLTVDRIAFAEEARFSGARFGATGGYTVYEGPRLNLDGRLGIAGGGYGDDVSSASIWIAIGLTTK